MGSTVGMRGMGRTGKKAKGLQLEWMEGGGQAAHIAREANAIALCIFCCADASTILALYACQHTHPS